MIAWPVAHERRDRLPGVTTLAGVVQLVHADRSVFERTALQTDPAVLEPAVAARKAFEVSVIQDAATFAAWLRRCSAGPHRY
jgi:hypothetical protein